MKPGPPKFAEAAVGLLIPPACREEVLGDLYERYAGLGQYLVDAVRSVPLVILSRIRRTTEPQVFVLEVLVLYLSFLSAAWCFDSKFLKDEWGLLRLAIPAAVALVAVMLADAYANPQTPSPLKAIQGATLAIGVACLSQAVLLIGNPEWAVPRWILFWGGYLSLILVSFVRMVYAPLADRTQSANGLAFWREHVGEAVKISPQAISPITCAVVAVLVTARGRSPWYALGLVLLVLYELAKKILRD